MLNMSVNQMRDFLIGKIRETCKTKNLYEEEREKRADVLRDIVQSELFAYMYDRHDTRWLLEQAKITRSEALRYLSLNSMRIESTRKSYLMTQDQIRALNSSLKAYNSMNVSSHDFVEREVREAKEELSEEIRQAEVRAEQYGKLLKEAEYQERLQYVMHRLEGIIVDPEYFAYLK
ncbi:MAG: hypothetical protein IKI57_06365 [Clostridia bacterium]|nr:hypothetical protein [Clostridia bacterium]